MHLSTLLALALTLGAGVSAPQGAPARYCQPVAYRDRVTPVGYEAVIRAAPGCRKAAKVRKENLFTKSIIGQPSLVPPGSAERVWVFTHRLYYTLDDRIWRRLEVH
ncbi:hypothetical protein [Deinococcus sp. YIM 77859]|uniref:hypothetical protein n=1 Tax=Deinococcus sp. YIM 77859 TaxID=1540221 RepID=UPI00055902B9|nr:hypothetical protein [Deinococcus sp. YIM 77859]